MAVPNLFNPAGRDVSGAIFGGLQAGQEREARGLALEGAQDKTALDSIISGIQQTALIPTAQGKLDFMQRRADQLTAEGRNPEHTQEGIEILQSEIDAGGDGSKFNASMNDLLKQHQATSGARGASARAFAPQTIRKPTGEKDAEGNDIFGLFNQQIVFDPRTKTSEVIETPIKGELVTSTGETVATQRKEEARLEGAKAKEKAKGKAAGEAESAPLIAKFKAEVATAVKLAEKAAAAKGETLTDLNRAVAGLPTVRKIVDQLKELALIATSTLGGRVFDTVVKEIGFGSTKGANARAKFTAIASNQAFPLLREMLGPAFTEGEGKRVLALLGDVDASPTQKIEQLESLMDAKALSIQSQQREVGQDVTPIEELTAGQPVFSAALNREITEQDIAETLQATPGLTREQLLQQLQVQ